MAFRYLFICDLEATCDMASPGHERQISKDEHEIIEFPFVLYDTRERAVVCQQQNYVKPQKTKVTQFCEKLTGITQSLVDEKGESLQVVVDRIEQAIEGKAGSTCIVFDGNWDIALLHREFRDKKVRVKNATFWGRYIDLKSAFRHAFPVDQYPDSNFHPVPSLSFMKRYLGAQNSQLQAHVGIDDCLQIKEILEKLFDRGHELKADALIEYEQSQDDFIKDFNYSFDVNTVTPESLSVAMDFDVDKDVVAIYRVSHIPDAKNAVATYLFVLTDEYKAQIFFLRANVAVMAYSKTHFEHLCFRNTPSLLYAVRSSEAIKSPAPGVLDKAASFLSFPRLYQTCSELANNLMHEMGRLIRSGKYDVAQQREATLHAELSSAAQLAGIDWKEPWSGELNQLQAQVPRFLALLGDKTVPMMRKKISVPDLVEKHATFGLTLIPVAPSSQLLSAPPFNAPQLSHSMFNCESILVDAETKQVQTVLGPVDRPSHRHADTILYQEVLDGVRCTLWFDGKAWRVLIDPLYFPRFPQPLGYNYNELSRTVDEDLFWSIWKKRGYKLPSKEAHTHLCFCFTMVLPSAGIVECSEDDLVYDFTLDATQAFAPVLHFLDTAEQFSWRAARRLRDGLDYMAPPTRVRGAWQLHACGARFLEETPNYQCVRALTSLGGPYHPSAVQLLLQLALFVDSPNGSWFSSAFPKFAHLWNQVTVWLQAKIEQTNNEFTAARYLPRNAFYSTTQRSSVKHWLHGMKNVGADDALSYVRSYVTMESLSMTWKKDQKGMKF